MNLKNNLPYYGCNWVNFCLCMLVAALSSVCGSIYADDNICSSLLNDTEDLIRSDEDSTDNIKNNIIQKIILPLKEGSYLSLPDNDSTIRPLVVTFQEAIEQKLITLLADGKATSITAIIHTPYPATPLCTEANNSSVLNESMHPDMQKDSARIKTIQKRTTTLRSMAACGEKMKLYIVYAKNRESQESMNIYRELLQNKEKYPSLTDAPLKSGTTISTDLIGATYIINTSENKSLIFSLTGVQACNAANDTLNNWMIWLGPETDTKVSDRLKKVQALYEQCDNNNLSI